MQVSSVNVRTYISGFKCFACVLCTAMGHWERIGPRVWKGGLRGGGAVGDTARALGFPTEYEACIVSLVCTAGGGGEGASVVASLTIRTTQHLCRHNS